MNINVELPEKLTDALFSSARFVVLFGGRGSTKSWSIAKRLLIAGRVSKEKILCGREIQKSIKDSVHAVLRTQIEKMGFADFYEVQNTSIIGKNGTEFIFAGLKHNIDNIKSMEGITKVWVSEAHNVSKSSWDKLIPTLREEGSQIFIDFNPELEDDETYKRFVLNTPANAKVVKINFNDNPWFPQVLREEMEACKAKNYDEYLNIWEGHCRQALEGAVYADELRKAREENRITSIPYTSALVDCYFDLGHSDATAVWFTQSIGHEFRYIDYYENQFKKIQHYIEEMQRRSYIYGKIILPHDAEYETLNADRTTAQIMRASFPNAQVIVLPRLGITDGIDAARTIFNQCWFDEKKCSDGLQALRHYRYDKDPDTGKTSKNPLHDWSSHGADSFRYSAIHITEKNETKRPRQQNKSWMS
jgi:phage terminase large subunit